jgi:methyltransferase (TIGR00027 family)
MEEGKPSRTAQQNALFRALEARHPAKTRVADDRLAVHFLAPEFRLLAELARVPPFRKAIELFIDWRWPGPRAGMVVRTRFLDDEISNALSGVSQILILGAGFDTRAFRLPSISNIRVFEVDHPSTQRAKRDTVVRLFGSVPENLIFVGVDFARDDLRNQMEKAGFHFGAKTLVLWEGVTNYLTADSVDATFRLTAAAVSSGSPIFFTYIDRGILDGSRSFTGAAESSRAVEKVGEPYTFGFDPNEVKTYLASRGFELLDDLAVSEAADRYYGDSRPKVYSYYHVVKASRR